MNLINGKYDHLNLDHITFKMNGNLQDQDKTIKAIKVGNNKDLNKVGNKEEFKMDNHKDLNKVGNKEDFRMDNNKGEFKPGIN